LLLTFKLADGVLTIELDGELQTGVTTSLLQSSGETAKVNVNRSGALLLNILPTEWEMDFTIPEPDEAMVAQFFHQP